MGDANVCDGTKIQLPFSRFHTMQSGLGTGRKTQFIASGDRSLRENHASEYIPLLFPLL
jgi:hypothetical protein